MKYRTEKANKCWRCGAGFYWGIQNLCYKCCTTWSITKDDAETKEMVKEMTNFRTQKVVEGITQKLETKQLDI
mgnify:CR=1 FL=1